MSSLASELLILLVIFLIIGGLFVAASFGKKTNNEINDSEKNMDDHESPSTNSKNKKIDTKKK
jgi:uncharacterized membrane protein